MGLGVRTSRTYLAWWRWARRAQRSASALRRRSPYTRKIFGGEAGPCRRRITRPEPSPPELASAARHLRQRQTRSADDDGFRAPYGPPLFWGGGGSRSWARVPSQSDR